MIRTKKLRKKASLLFSFLTFAHDSPGIWPTQGVFSRFGGISEHGKGDGPAISRILTRFEKEGLEELDETQKLVICSRHWEGLRRAERPECRSFEAVIDLEEEMIRSEVESFKAAHENAKIEVVVSRKIFTVATL